MSIHLMFNMINDLLLRRHNAILLYINLHFSKFLSLYSVTHTTRKPHKEETTGKDYHFVDLEKFEFDIRWVSMDHCNLWKGWVFLLTLWSLGF